LLPDISDCAEDKRQGVAPTEILKIKIFPEKLKPVWLSLETIFAVKKP
jgi:hypothetical protein